jgi:transcription elongation GreA/GreB family factor
MTGISSPRRPRAASIKARREATARAESSAVILTTDGRLLMEERLRHLRADLLPALVPLLVDRERDERHTAEFERLTAEADWLDHLLATSLTTPAEGGAEVRLGSRVLLRLAGGVEEWVRPVHPVEAFLDEERISAISPLSQALLGASIGQTVTVHGPSSTWRCRIVEVRDVGAEVLVGAAH